MCSLGFQTEGCASARAITKNRKWLPVAQRIEFKTALLVYKSINGLAPTDISDILVTYKPSRTSGTGLLLVPRVRIKHGEAAFEFHEAKTNVQGEVKTFLFSSAYLQ